MRKNKIKPLKFIHFIFLLTLRKITSRKKYWNNGKIMNELVCTSSSKKTQHILKRIFKKIFCIMFRAIMNFLLTKSFSNKPYHVTNLSWNNSPLFFVFFSHFSLVHPGTKLTLCIYIYLLFISKEKKKTFPQIRYICGL